MRSIMIGLGIVVVGLSMSAARAEDRRETSDKVLTSVMSGLLGVPQESPTAAYTAQEQARLAQLLQSGQYVTTRQGEPVDTIVYGVPLTRVEHVYTARPIPPSQAPAQ